MTIFAHTTAKQKQNRAECSDETERPVQLRETAVNANPSHETILFITPKIRICRRIDKTLESIDNLDKDLDLKDKWLGIKKLKTNTRHNLTRRKTKKGNPIPRHQLADFSAKQLQTTKLFWTLNTEPGTLKSDTIINENILHTTYLISRFRN